MTAPTAAEIARAVQALEGLLEWRVGCHSGPWDVATQVERGEHGRVPIGIVSGCEMDHDHGRIDSHTGEQEVCVVTEFARVHLNDSRKPPLHPDNAKELRTARLVCDAVNVLDTFGVAIIYVLRQSAQAAASAKEGR